MVVQACDLAHWSASLIISSCQLTGTETATQNHAETVSSLSYALVDEWNCDVIMLTTEYFNFNWICDQYNSNSLFKKCKLQKTYQKYCRSLSRSERHAILFRFSNLTLLGPKLVFNSTWMSQNVSHITWLHTYQYSEQQILFPIFSD